MSFMFSHSNNEYVLHLAPISDLPKCTTFWLSFNVFPLALSIFPPRMNSIMLVNRWTKDDREARYEKQGCFMEVLE
jgi:hypothetical protein